MKISLLILGLILATSYSSVVQTKPERKLADEAFLKKQKQVLDLFIGVGHTENFHSEYENFDFNANIGNFLKPEVVKDFLHAYSHGFLPLDAVFSLACHHTRKDTMKLFDLMYFAKDFTTFYGVASWARKHTNPIQFLLTYTTALLHREDCQYFTLPPHYEILPNYFVPAGTLHDVYDAKMLGVKERKFTFNNTGYEYLYHSLMYGGPLNRDVVNHLDYKISYIREDVGVNAWYGLSAFVHPGWMAPEKYRATHWYNRGEANYYKHQQILARYNLERLANKLPFTERLNWNEAVKVGYNPRLDHFNGESLFIRPDNVVPLEANRRGVRPVIKLEDRLLDAIDAGVVWNTSDPVMIKIREKDSTDLLGKIVFGVSGRPNKRYFGNYYWEGLEALAFLTKTSNDKHFVGGALSTMSTTLRDPLYYEYLTRVIKFFQYYKRFQPRYKQEELSFPGVKVTGFEVDKLVTYFDNFEFEVTNAVPFKDQNEFNEHHYYARQYRLNHKPYTYKLTVNSDVNKEAFVRVFIGPKFDALDHELTLEQSRLTYVEIDRFPAKLVAGDNVLERSSKESPLFTSDPEGLKSLYNRINNALKGSEQYFYSNRYTCGVPDRLQLPVGWKNGQAFKIAVVVTSNDQPHYTGDEKLYYGTCGSSKLQDNKILGFPFDRPIDHEHTFQVPNILFKDVLVYHKEDSDVNRS